jgi:hypothetical protein
MEKHSDMDWTISIYIDPGREMPLVSLSLLSIVSLSFALSLYVCMSLGSYVFVRASCRTL